MFIFSSLQFRQWKIRILERLIPPEPTSSPQGINGAHVILSLIFCFIDRCLSFCPSSFGHYVVCPYVLLLAIMLFVLLSFFFWPLCCLSLCPSFGHYVVCLFVLLLLAIMLFVLQFTTSGYPICIFKLFW
jgi:hypothetical protein